MHGCGANQSMTFESGDNWLPTRTTLLGRLKDWDDEASWSDFFETYGRLIFRVASKSGLRPAEAEDVVQETVVAVAKHIRAFRYDRNRGLLNRGSLPSHAQRS